MSINFYVAYSFYAFHDLIQLSLLFAEDKGHCFTGTGENKQPKY